MIPGQGRIAGGKLAFARAAALALLVMGAGPALADKIKNPTAVFAGLDKITGRIISFEVAVDETVQFGALQLTPRVCFSRPPTESPNTTGFIEVDEVTLDNKYRRIFTGWMFAASPGLHGIEHAIYDIWLTECKDGKELIVEAKEADDTPALAGRQGNRRQQQAERAPDQRRAERLDVEQPRGVPVQPVQAPSRRFFPTNAPSPAGGNPFGGGGGGGGNRDPGGFILR